jgi:DNA helicase HerA-like ATPase
MARFSVRPSLTNKRQHTFGDSLTRGTDIVHIGRLAEAGPNVDVMFDSSGEFVLGIFGKRGSGKSYCLGSILEGLCTVDRETSLGRSSQTRAVLVFDTLNIFWTLEQSLRAEDEAQFGPELAKLRSWGIAPCATKATVFVPRGFSSATTPSSYSELTLSPSALSVDDWSDLLETDLHSERVGQLLFETYTKVADDGWRRAQGPVPAKPAFNVDDLLLCLREDIDIQALYAQETIRALSQRLQSIGHLSFFAGETPLRDLLKPGRASVVLMNRLPDTLRSVLTSVLMRRILAERAEASELQKQLRFNRTLTSEEKRLLEQRLTELIPPTIVAIDEAQNVLPSERATKATQTIVKYVREGRNHGLSFMFTTQQPSAIDNRILAQVDTIIGHKLTIGSDVRRFEDNQKSRNPDAVVLEGRNLDFSEWLRALSQGQAIVSNTEEDRNFAIDVRPRVCPHGGHGSL